MLSLDYNSIKLGILILILIFTGLLFQRFWAKIFKIKLLEFNIFMNPLKKVSINKVDYTLGWLPLGGSLKMLGMTSDVNEQKSFSSDDLRWTFFNKSNLEKFLVMFTPSILHLILGILLPLLIFSMNDEKLNLGGYITFLQEFLKSVFGSSAQKNSFGLLTSKIFSENNSLVFSFLLISSIIFFSSLITNICTFLSFGSKQSKSKDIITTILFFIPSILVLWFIPKSVLHYYNLSELVTPCINFLFGITCSGILLYFIMIYALKLHHRQNN
jgi:hypothetical protein